MRRTPTIVGVIATLYLKGISSSDFGVAVRAIYGEGVGYREGSGSWKELLIELKHRGMTVEQKRVQPRAKTLIHDIYLAQTERDANRAFDHFIEAHQDRFPKAVETLSKDRDQLMAFYRFPAAHWKHIHSTNVIESAFAPEPMGNSQSLGMGNHTSLLRSAVDATDRERKACALSSRSIPIAAFSMPPSWYHDEHRAHTRL